MKRIWTNPVFYRNVEESDLDLVIWHLPSEKTYGLTDLYRIIIDMLPGYGFSLSPWEYTNIVSKILGVPFLPPLMKSKYYLLSYYRAITKRAKKVLSAGSQLQSA